MPPNCECPRCTGTLAPVASSGALKAHWCINDGTLVTIDTTTGSQVLTSVPNERKGKVTDHSAFKTFFNTCNRCATATRHVCHTITNSDIHWCEQDGVLVERDGITGNVVATWVPKGLTEAFGKLQEDKDTLLIKQAAALDEIAEILSGKEWDSDTAVYIAEVIQHTGRNIQDID